MSKSARAKSSFKVENPLWVIIQQIVFKLMYNVNYVIYWLTLGNCNTMLTNPYKYEPIYIWCELKAMSVFMSSFCQFSHSIVNITINSASFIVVVENWAFGDCRRFWLIVHLHHRHHLIISRQLHQQPSQWMKTYFVTNDILWWRRVNEPTVLFRTTLQHSFYFRLWSINFYWI